MNKYGLVSIPLDITAETALKLIDTNRLIMTSAMIKAITEGDKAAQEEITGLSQQLNYLETMTKAVLDGTFVDSPAYIQ